MTTAAELTAEIDALKRAVADVTLAWAGVENALVMVLAEIIGHPEGNLASAIYFAPNGMEIRFRIVDAAFKSYVSRAYRALANGPQTEDHLKAEWDQIDKTVGRLRKARNKAAHGEITTFEAPKNRGVYARLTDPMLKMDDGREDALNRRQKPGMGARDLANSATSVRRVASRIAALAQVLEDLAKHAPSQKTPPRP